MFLPTLATPFPSFADAFVVVAIFVVVAAAIFVAISLVVFVTLLLLLWRLIFLLLVLPLLQGPCNLFRCYHYCWCYNSYCCLARLWRHVLAEARYDQHEGRRPTTTTGIIFSRHITLGITENFYRNSVTWMTKSPIAIHTLLTVTEMQRRTSSSLPKYLCMYGHILLRVPIYSVYRRTVFVYQNTAGQFRGILFRR